MSIANDRFLSLQTLRRAAAGFAEAIPVVLLAAALLAPAFAVLAGPYTGRPHDAGLGHVIAEQGNRALLTIRDDARDASRHMAPPALPAYAGAGATDAPGDR